MRVDIVIDSSPVDALLRLLKGRLADTRPAFVEIGQELEAISMEAFRRAADPESGRPWEQSRRAKEEFGQTLIDTGRLRGSVTSRARHLEAVVGSNVAYARIHQEGGKTPPRVIRPKNKKALFWPGARHPVRQVRHPGSVMPARPYMGIGPGDWDEISGILTHHLERA